MEQRRLTRPIRSRDKLGRLTRHFVDKACSGHDKVLRVDFISRNHFQVVWPKHKPTLCGCTVKVHKFDFTFCSVQCKIRDSIFACFQLFQLVGGIVKCAVGLDVCCVRVRACVCVCDRCFCDRIRTWESISGRGRDCLD